MIYSTSGKLTNKPLRWWLVVVIVFGGLAGPSSLHAGAYVDSAHGDATNGVNRMAGYARGNCGHCHEQHASVNGTEPDPVADGLPSPYGLFTSNFVDTATKKYAATDNICFRCHDGTTNVQDLPETTPVPVTNLDYSETFGCGTTLVNDIMEAFNQTGGSYHNLADLYDLVTANNNVSFPAFDLSSNPCSTCHNPHLARRNNANPQDVTFSALSRPNVHNALFTDSMADYVAANGVNYEPPYCSATTNREPAYSTDAATGRANTIDYVTFCTSCHSLADAGNNPVINSTELNRNVLVVDWSSAQGDKHGLRAADSPSALKDPYASVGGSFVLSCMDCHEPHGSPNITLLRRRANGGDLAGSITTALQSLPTDATSTDNNNKEMGYLCERCHLPDATTSNLPEPSWEDVHHLNTGSPYAQSGPCSTCHSANGMTPPAIGCDLCHFHGGNDSWLGSNAVGLDTF